MIIFKKVCISKCRDIRSYTVYRVTEYDLHGNKYPAKTIKLIYVYSFESMDGINKIEIHDFFYILKRKYLKTLVL